MNAAPFPWPTPAWAKSSPVWTPRGFEVDGQTRPVLEFVERDSGWRDEFNEFVEQETGNGENPVDRASRRMAVDSFRATPGKFGRENVILEAGSSSGFLIRDLRQAFPTALVVASDYLAGPLVRLAEWQPGIPLLQFDLRLCPLPDNSVTGFAALNVLEHIDDDKACLHQIHRILKPGGIVHLEVPAGPELYDIYDEYFLHQRRYKMKSFVKLIADHGFRITKATHLGFFAFPYFRHIKLRGQKHMKATAAVKKQIITNELRRVVRSKPLGFVFQAEALLGRVVSWPCGIRCVVTATKI